MRQQGSLEYIWAPIGARPLAVRDNRHDSAYLFGALCPSRATGAAIIMPAANSEAMSEYLKEIATQVAPGAHAVLVCDGAGWLSRPQLKSAPHQRAPSSPSRTGPNNLSNPTTQGHLHPTTRPVR